MGIKIVDFDQRVDGALIGCDDEVEIAPPTLPLGLVGVGLHNVGIAKFETTLPACELVGMDHGDDVAHALRCSRSSNIGRPFSRHARLAALPSAALSLLWHRTRQ